VLGLPPPCPRARARGSPGKSRTSESVKRFRRGLVFKAHRLAYHPTLGLRVIKARRSVEFRVQGFGVRVSGFGVRVSVFGSRVSGFELRVSGFELRVSGFGFRASGFELRVSSFGFRVSVHEREHGVR